LSVSDVHGDDDDDDDDLLNLPTMMLVCCVTEASWVDNWIREDKVKVGEEIETARAEFTADDSAAAWDFASSASHRTQTGSSAPRGSCECLPCSTYLWV